MLISCPYCGPRDLSEFSYQGDASRMRPDAASTDIKAWHDYVYNRPNPAGPHREYWQHTAGCRAHLIVTRDTLTHEIHEVTFARAALRAVGGRP
ncbi:sarcosine oxidase subunit delta [Chelativorans sp.]|uniref:sarcosine oxidase subunit delta n=1 Tax=Chelativorans sp. TaxID=2203393 RepID=UPI00281271E2|nr:sarcosine oxidase subunit delta [Chelativorans sp.]